ncbi:MULTISPECIES: sigma factor-like helix-turn-helix DNA-binding protein [unclassified Glycomyces]|uniref:helix-turn-helix domain-containing protein n=1 Tax=Glycomyces sp. NRRL B-16210 TaxID=1463821 RepID=UPI00141501C9
MNTPPQVSRLLGRLSGPLEDDGGTSGPSWRSRTTAEYTIEDSSIRIPRPLYRRLSPDQRTVLVDAFASGVKQRELAAQYGISVRSVKRLVRGARNAGTTAAHT